MALLPAARAPPRTGGLQQAFSAWLPPRCQPASALEGPHRAATGRTLAGGALRVVPKQAPHPDSHRVATSAGARPAAARRGPSKTPPSSHGGTVWRVTQATAACPERFTLDPGGEAACAKRSCGTCVGRVSKTAGAPKTAAPGNLPTSLGRSFSHTLRHRASLPPSCNCSAEMFFFSKKNSGRKVSKGLAGRPASSLRFGLREEPPGARPASQPADLPANQAVDAHSFGLLPLLSGGLPRTSGAQVPKA